MAVETKKGIFTPMIPTLNPATAGGDLPLAEFVRLAARNGFSGVEFSIREAANLIARSSLHDVAAIFEEPKILPIVFDLPVEWRQDEATYRAGLKHLPQLARLAQDLDCTRCVTWVLPDGGIPVAEYAERGMKRFVEIARILGGEGVRLGLEFIGPQHYRANPDNVWFHDIPSALDVVNAIENAAQLENVGLLVDSFHWYTSGGTIMDLASIPIEMLVHVHINDAPGHPQGGAMSREAQQDRARLLPGESGVIDIVGFLKTLAAVGYDGPLAVETFSAALNALPPDEAAARAAAAVHNSMRAAAVKPVRLL
jgi:sugar phosphate isomerase/epimerase